jgi:hypothetical protein
MTLPSIAGASFPGRNGNLAVELPDTFCGGSYVRLFNSGGGDVGPLTFPSCDMPGGWVESLWTTPWGWSPNGQRLLIERSEPLGYLTIAADGGDPFPIPALNRFEEPSFGPDGTTLAAVGSSGYSIWKVPLDTTWSSERLVALRCPRWCRAGERIVVWKPRWSPDGKMIAFVAAWESSGRAGPEGIWLVSARTGKLIRRVAADGRQFDWAPNSKRIVYRNQSSDLWTVGVDGRGSKRLVRGDEWPQSWPAWSPDGRWIAWTKSTYVPITDGSSLVKASLWRVRAQGGRPGRVRVLFVGEVYDDVDASELAWQPLP